MKHLTCILAVVGIWCATSTLSAQCTWRFCSEIDCIFQMELFVECPPNAPTSVSGTVLTPPGCWGSPGYSSFNALRCGRLPSPCVYKVKLNGVLYSHGDIICCTSSPPEDCVTCNCAYVNIDPNTGTICLQAATSGTTASGTTWSCP